MEEWTNEGLVLVCDGTVSILYATSVDCYTKAYVDVAGAAGGVGVDMICIGSLSVELNPCQRSNASPMMMHRRRVNHVIMKVIVSQQHLHI